MIFRGSSQWRRLTCGSLHGVADLAIAVICPGARVHSVCFVPYKDRLPTRGHHLIVINTIELASREASTVDNHISLLARMMDKRCFRNVVEDCSLENDAILQALRRQPRKIDGGVDAHGREANAALIAIR